MATDDGRGQRQASSFRFSSRYAPMTLFPFRFSAASTPPVPAGAHRRASPGSGRADRRPPTGVGLVAVVLIAFLSGCDVGSVDDDLALILRFEAVSTVVSGQITDAATQAPITDVPVTIRFGGADADRVVDVDGGSVSSITLEEVSLLSFGLDGAVPSPDRPVDLVLNVTAEGYLETSRRILLADDEQTFSLPLVRFADLPPGVETTSVRFPVINGVSPETVVVTTPAEAVTGARASLTLPAGTRIRDASGRPLTGTLTGRVTYFSNQVNPARAAFPGGFTGVQIDRDETGAPAQGTFLTAGFAAVEVVGDDGREAEMFDAPIDISIDVPPGTPNPETGRDIDDGDPVPVYSLDEDTGTWTFAARAPARLVGATVNTETGPNASRSVRFETEHLTYWNLDYLDDDVCRAAAPILIDGLPTGFYRWTLEQQSDGGVLEAGDLYDDTLQFFNAPRDLPVTLRIRDEQGTEIAAADFGDLCAGGTIPVEEGVGGGGGRVTIETDVEVVCPDDDIEIRPSNVVVWYRLADGVRWNRAVLQDGRLVLPSVIDGASYVFGLWLEDEWLFETVRLAPGSIDDEGVEVVQRDASTYDVEIRYTDTDGVICD